MQSEHLLSEMKDETSECAVVDRGQLQQQQSVLPQFRLHVAVSW